MGLPHARSAYEVSRAGILAIGAVLRTVPAMTKDIKRFPTTAGEAASSSMIHRIYAEGTDSAIEFALTPCREDDDNDNAYRLTFRCVSLAPGFSSSLAPASRAASDRTSRPEGARDE